MVLLVITAYFLLVNFIGFGSMALDKRKAVKGSFRIPEANLFIIALIGGSIGSIFGMYTFRHKTRKWYFVYGMPLILIAQTALIIFLFSYAPIEILTM